MTRRVVRLLPLLLALHPAGARADDGDAGSGLFTWYLDPIAASTQGIGVGGSAGVVVTGFLNVETGATYYTQVLCGKDCVAPSLLREVRAKFYVRSFYVNAGAGLEEQIFNSSHFDVGYAAHSMSEGFTAAIGNMKRGRGFNIGCDWVGFYLPVTAKVVEFREGPDYDPRYHDGDVDRVKSKAMESMVYFLRFHLGMTL